jgi:hypothetical protein
MSMEKLPLKIQVKDWKVITDDEKKTKTIGGTYVVMCGPTEVAKAQFNNGYGSTDIAIPAKVLAAIEELDDVVRGAIIENFTGQEASNNG